MAILVQTSFGQIWTMRSGVLTVVSEATLNTVKGSTQKFDCDVNTKSKAVNFPCDATTLDFGNPMIKENFSTQLLNTKKFPTITFIGSIVKLDEGKKTISLKGVMEMNGQKKNIEVTSGWIKNQKDVKLDFIYEFMLSDFKIEVPNLLLDTISEKVSVSINAILIQK